MREEPDEKDRGTGEVRIRSEQREPRGTSSAASAASAASMAMVPETKGATPDLSPASSHSSGYGSLRSIAESSSSSNPPELPARLPGTPRKNGCFAGPVKAVKSTSKSFSSSTMMDSDDAVPPPPPPPRNPIPRMMGIRAPANLLPLTKSSSQVTSYPFFSVQILTNF